LIYLASKGVFKLTNRDINLGWEGICHIPTLNFKRIIKAKRTCCFFDSLSRSIPYQKSITAPDKVFDNPIKRPTSCISRPRCYNLSHRDNCYIASSASNIHNHRPLRICYINTRPKSCRKWLLYKEGPVGPSIFSSLDNGTLFNLG